MRSMSRSTAWLIAPAPPAERAPPRQVRRTSPSEGSPATYIVVTVVKQQQRLHLRLGQRQVVAQDRRSAERGAAVGMAAVCARRLHAGQATGWDSRAGCSARPVRWAIASRMSRIGRALRTSGRTSKLCGSGGESANHSSESPPQGSWPASAPPSRLSDRVDERQQDPDREDEGADRGDQVVGVDPGAVEELVGVDDLALVGAGEEERHEGERGCRATIVQKEIRARLSPIVRPVIFGNQ